MDLFRFCLFSDVEGRVVLNGKPIEGAVIERSYRLAGTDDVKTDMTRTDSSGYFRFGRIWKYSPFSFLPFELNVFQEIWIRHENQSYEAWRLLKSRPLEADSELPRVGLGEDFDSKTFDPQAEYPKRKIRLICDLAARPSWKEKLHGRDNVLFGICAVVNKL